MYHPWGESLVKERRRGYIEAKLANLESSCVPLRPATLEMGGALDVLGFTRYSECDSKPCQ